MKHSHEQIIAWAREVDLEFGELPEPYRKALKLPVGTLRNLRNVSIEQIERFAELVASAGESEPMAWEYRWLNPGDYSNIPESMLEWRRVEPTWNQAVIDKVRELEAYRYKDKQVYECRAIYTHPTPSPAARVPMTDEQIDKVLDKLIDTGVLNPKLFARAIEAFHEITTKEQQ